MPVNGQYSCPWCPTRVVVVDSEQAAREWMEWHLDAHMAVGVPRTGTTVQSGAAA